MQATPARSPPRDVAEHPCIASNATSPGLPHQRVLPARCVQPPMIRVPLATVAIYRQRRTKPPALTALPRVGQGLRGLCIAPCQESVARSSTSMRPTRRAIRSSPAPPPPSPAVTAANQDGADGGHVVLRWARKRGAVRAASQTACSTGDSVSTMGDESPRRTRHRGGRCRAPLSFLCFRVMAADQLPMRRVFFQNAAGAGIPQDRGIRARQRSCCAAPGSSAESLLVSSTRYGQGWARVRCRLQQIYHVLGFIDMPVATARKTSPHRK
ncbi:hypothetical protein HETIRDRAFT_430788 [Heterobasidion irregulare TC 32-1]|uniref:Uncharacterized protein n=1 Tax=Heterobasidion irregulare (strain TC 32-1) TaxID=747525 RepID=W4JPC2_HETIT|nr:uncharacterized protein HETIRDRAFT_430788 [Heterobasidion irregulare TC 32-1]ETW75417.1 hypothetical protein HETIRDRAFT_430788 [Heterobasidion irregulare TC 32-1]